MIIDIQVRSRTVIALNIGGGEPGNGNLERTGGSQPGVQRSARAAGARPGALWRWPTMVVA